MTFSRQNSLRLAMEAGDRAFKRGIQDIRDKPSYFEIPEDKGIDRCASEAKMLVYSATGIDRQLFLVTNLEDALTVLTKGMETCFAQKEKLIGQMTRGYIFGASNALKSLEPGFKALLAKRSSETGANPSQI